MTNKQIIVVDLDGTLCNSGHREHLARAGLWDNFHSLLGGDTPWPDVAGLIDILAQQQYTIVGLTGRNEKYRNATLEWLTKNDIWIDTLLMRPDDNYQSDHVLKPQMLLDYLNANPDEGVWFVLEDRDKVVEAWRNEGYNCWQVRPGGY